MAKRTITDEKTTDTGSVIPEPPAKGELVKLDLHRQPSFMSEQTAWSRIPLTQRVLLKAKAPLLSETELASAVELAYAYGLDPYTGEIWFTKSNPYVKRNGETTEGKLLIMVGRDGLRKIVQRNGLWMKCDVVHFNDDVQVIHSADGDTTITHNYKLKDRGPIIGAWALVRKGGPSGEPMGWFYAPLEEYQPSSPDSRSPWAKQVSVMILAAAERQAARQATPLGGLLIEGEDEVINSTAVEIENELDAETTNLPENAKELVERARAVGFHGYDYGTVEVILGGQSQEVIDTWINGAHNELNIFVAEQTVRRLTEAWSEASNKMRTEATEIIARLEQAQADKNEEALAAAEAEQAQLRERYAEAQAEYKRQVAEAKGEAEPEANAA